MKVTPRNIEEQDNHREEVKKMNGEEKTGRVKYSSNRLYRRNGRGQNYRTYKV